MHKGRRTSNIDFLFKTVTKVGKSVAKAHAQAQREQRRQQKEYERRVATHNRFIAQAERDRLRIIKQNEVAMRRAEREQKRAEREREKVARLHEKHLEQQRQEQEIAEIEETNYLWTHIHSLIEDIISIQEVRDSIAKCDYEQNNNIRNCLFEEPYPNWSDSQQIAINQANLRFDIAKSQQTLQKDTESLSNLVFNEIEPTEEGVSNELWREAEVNIRSFLPWKQKRLRKEYVLNNFDSRFNEKYSTWKSQKEDFLIRQDKLKCKIENDKKQLKDLEEQKISFISTQTKELYNKEVKKWEEKKNIFYNDLRDSLKDLIDGDKEYVLSALSSIFPDEDIPAEYFVECVYDEKTGKVYVDLDLPEIEDIPDQKIVLTSTGKKSIRKKSQTDLREDYIHTILGLSMHVAYLIFNISVNITDIEVMGYTQRKEVNSAVTTDEYVFVINFKRDVFEKIYFNKLSPIQILDYFQHNINISKSFILKKIDLKAAFYAMEAFKVADYDQFIKSVNLDEVNNSKYSPLSKTPENPLSNKHSSTSETYINDTSLETFNKSVKFYKEFYSFMDRLSKDNNVNKHADNLNGVNITMSSGNFNGDGNTKTYRGKLFFCAIVDLYRSLERMHISQDTLIPSNYAFAQFSIKTFTNIELEYLKLSVYKNVYTSLIEMLRQINSSIPLPEHEFLIAEILSDYTKDKTLYEDYINLIKDFIDIVKSSIHADVKMRAYIYIFIQQLKKKGLYPDKV